VTRPQHLPARWHLRFGLLACTAAALALASSALPAAAAPAHSAADTSQAIRAAGGPTTLQRVATVNLQALANADASRAKSAAPNAGQAGTHQRQAPMGQPPWVARAAAKAPAAKAPAAATGLTGFTSTNVAGEKGFDGLTSAINAANNPVIGDVSPPDQGLAVGASSAGTAIVEFINQSLNIYSTSGKTLLGAIPGYQVFGIPANSFLSDPRAYWDPQTGHWFLTMFIFGDGVTAPLSTQFIAVSQTTSPFGSYAVFSIDTSDSTNTAGGCPCFGDFDQVGADNSGFYIATNEFSVDGPNFNGSVLYAMSKSGLITAAQGNGPAPVVQSYHVAFAGDAFAAYHLSPSSVTQGAAAPNTEYFVESNANSNFGSGLEVYALLGTSVLSSGGRPALVMTSVATQDYSSPPNAFQKSGPFPLGQSLGQTGVGQLQTDFDAVQEVTYAGGRLFAELSTGFNFGTGQNSGAAWFVLRPTAASSSVSVTLVSNGVVQTKEELLYPVIGVDASGNGYLNFAVSSTGRYPSTGYMVFDGAAGPTGQIHLSAKGTTPLDDFTCYPPFSTGQCRYGDYSMAQNYSGKIYMASEYTAPQPRDTNSNWGTRIWFAPVP
jgi:hypothetical protein